MPARTLKTRDRILELSLNQFNALGEPNVTSAAIAEELAISPGNLYYHFRSKQEIVNTLFDHFEREMIGLLQDPRAAFVDLDQLRRRLRVKFALMWRFRFLYRDLNELLSRNRRLETRFSALLDQQGATLGTWCDSLAHLGVLRLGPQRLPDLSANLLLVCCHWLPFAYTRHARRISEPGFETEATERALHQAMALLHPYLVEPPVDATPRRPRVATGRSTGARAL